MKVKKTPEIRKNLKALTQTQKRPMLQLSRQVKYGAKSFLRNSWLSVAATFVMIMALTIVVVALASRDILNNTLKDITENLTFSVYLENDLGPERAELAAERVSELPSVREVSLISPDEAMELYRTDSQTDQSMIDASYEAENRFPWIMHIKVVNPNETAEVESFINTNPVVADVLAPNRPPSFEGEKREIINNIARTTSFVEKVGLIASILFVAVAILIVFNTIRMAIFNRREEIYMMRLVGASHSFIRGPFIIEAMIYGLLAALATTGIAFLLLSRLRVYLEDYGVTVAPTYDFVNQYWWAIALGLVLLGIMIGALASSLAVRKYLRPHRQR
ncbi:MAG: ABC transporter permease [Candidatus Nomurabacteria bacterium]|jgi:cell division transport system permease protein|nr:ABC transporter permease [Candidatus Nomurabacteria bacterium]